MLLFSGIQPSGDLHLGNYLGAIQHWIALQKEHEAFYCVVDLHALTTIQDPVTLRKNSLRTAAMVVALGVDPEQSPVFIQSHVHEHTELAWILNTIAKIGELERMTQFKDKAKRFPKNINVGLFTYPVLQAADVLLYHAEGVPVGEDQRQHIELMRHLGERFNTLYGEVFTLPQPLIQKSGARIKSLTDPMAKMSKSAKSEKSYIALLDDAGTVRDKIKRAVTDSGEDIRAVPEKPAMTNLLTIYSLLTEKSITDLEMEYSGKGYGVFKQDLAEIIVAFLSPFQKRIQRFEQEPERIVSLVTEGANKARTIARMTMEKVREAVGLV